MHDQKSFSYSGESFCCVIHFDLIFNGYTSDISRNIVHYLWENRNVLITVFCELSANKMGKNRARSRVKNILTMHISCSYIYILNKRTMVVQNSE